MKSKPPTGEAPSSAPPPPPGATSSTPYVIGILVLAGGIAALLYSRCDAETGSTPQANKPQPTASEQAVNADLPEFAPPPPPEHEDAGADAGDAGGGGKGPARVASNGDATAPGPTGACSKCGQGKSSSALVSAVQGAAGTAHGCYNRALKKGGSQGKMTVSVSVGSNGSVCGASITSDTTGNPTLANCVLGKFRRTFPKPESGCVTINVPLNFETK